MTRASELRLSPISESGNSANQLPQCCTTTQASCLPPLPQNLRHYERRTRRRCTIAQLQTPAHVCVAPAPLPACSLAPTAALAAAFGPRSCCCDILSNLSNSSQSAVQPCDYNSHSHLISRSLKAAAYSSTPAAALSLQPCSCSSSSTFRGNFEPAAVHGLGPPHLQ